MNCFAGRSVVSGSHCIALAFFVLAGISAWPAEKIVEKASEKWASEIQTFETQDKNSPPPKGEILFVGSSTIRCCDVAKHFPKYKALNRGFGGSKVADSVYYFDQIVKPYEPRVIVFHAGNNDLTSGKSPELVCQDFKAFVKKVHVALPLTKLIYVGQQPNLARQSLWPKAEALNLLIAEVCKADTLLSFCDVSKVLLDQDGNPRADLFQNDKLHMNDAGYKLWAAALDPVISKALK